MFLRNYYSILGTAFFGKKMTIKGLSGGEKTLYYSDVNHCSPLLGFFQNSVSIAETNTSGVMFGTNSTPPTFEDYTIDNSGVSVAGTIAKTVNINDNGSVTAVLNCTLTNTGDAEITISEAGLKVALTNTGSVLFDRTVLDTPVTIPAGGVGQVEYTITFNLPTATA